MTASNPSTTPPSPRLILLLAAACGLTVANIYYAQPLAGPIGAALGLPDTATGLIVTLTQLGYGLGLLLAVPLGDRVENRRLTLALLALAATALALAGAAGQAPVFLAASLGIGLGSVAAQVLLPYAAHLAPPQMRGRAVGSVMSGLMLGVMLARPLASLLAQAGSWRLVFGLSAAAMLLLAAVLSRALPERRPAAQLRYGALLLSMAALWRHTPMLRRRALYHAGMFAAFSLFWTTAPLLLAGPAFGLSQGGLALFGLAGAAGPVAGCVADRGWTRPATALAMLAAAAAFAPGLLPGAPALPLLVAAALLLDFAVAFNVTLGLRAIFVLGAEHRSRLNGLYLTTFFLGGALGSALGGWAYARGGWPWAAGLGCALPLLALAYWATEG
ncbi:MFS transporter [Xylophilus sp.]|uniref:MFS transporter n=1 Tax=Xylophilus sp. TaxID=2653893 RepID=UPI0013BE6810|nr:MFS transporter [Xylophilus sp.]KAF1047903.1 MAG: putative transporter [Xylophilus sp.]